MKGVLNFRKKTFKRVLTTFIQYYNVLVKDGCGKEGAEL